MRFKAYFDASGAATDPVLTLAGFVSHAERWERFENRLHELLPPSVSMFHMTDFASSRNGWEDWKGDGTRRAAFFERLIALIRDHTSKGFAESLQLADFREVDTVFKLHELVGGPYSFLASAVLGRLKMWADKEPTSWREIGCLLEEGDEGQGDALARLSAEGFNVAPQNKAHTRSFDACDLAAWKVRRIVDDSFNKNCLSDQAGADRIFRALDLMETLITDKEIGVYKRDNILRICENQRVSKR